MKAVTVFELVHYLKGQLDFDDNIQNIIVCGEISNFTNHYSVHLYFSLKDERARINCVMFKGNASKLLFKPKNGDKVIVKANTSIYEGSGQLQLYVTEMKIDGIGELYLKYELLKKRLSDDGLFNNEHKKQKPLYPEKIAILVGDKSAAMSDIKTCFKRRWPVARTDYYPVLVQGDESSQDIINTLLKVDEKNYDAIILARGGGSIEDLWSFNDERLAYVIYNLNTFIITGVGHEQDFTIADFVADLRAPTPTASVELITPDINELKYDVKQYENRLKRLYIIRIHDEIQKLNNLEKHLSKNIYVTLDNHIKKLRILNSSLMHFKSEIIKTRSIVLNKKERMLYALNHQINDKIYNIKSDTKRIVTAIDKVLYDKKSHIKRMKILLKAFNIQNTLSRGYSIVVKDGHVIKNIEDILVNDNIEIKMINGILFATVKEISNG